MRIKRIFILLLLTILLSACQASDKESSAMPESAPVTVSAADGTIRLLLIVEAATLRAVLINDGLETLYCVPNDIILQQKREDQWFSVEQAWKHPHLDTDNIGSMDEYERIESQKSLSLVIYLDEYAFTDLTKLCRVCVPIYNINKSFIGYITEEFNYIKA